MPNNGLSMLDENISVIGRPLRKLPPCVLLTPNSTRENREYDQQRDYNDD